MKTLAVLLSLLLLIPLRADTPLVVVSARQYLVQGDSTIHLYLYSLDGKLIKQLTDDPGQDDHAPMFSRDGKTVFFTRITTGDGAPKQTGKYILDLSDGKITRVPDGGPRDIAARGFLPTVETVPFDELAFTNRSPGEPVPAEGTNAFALPAPDKSTSLVDIHNDTTSVYKLAAADLPQAKLLSEFPGYQKSAEDALDDYIASKEGPFLVGPDHYGALFVNRHRESMWVFDVHGRTWHALQPEWTAGDLFAPREKSGFYFLRCSMQPLGQTGKVVLCAYFEWWDATFHKAVLGPPLSVGYGAATWWGKGETSVIVDELRGS